MKDIYILIGCEESQAITLAFRNLGFSAFSCDLKPCSGGYPEWHIQDDIFKVLDSRKWEALIVHPPCTYLSVSGACWMYHPEDKNLPTSERRSHPKFPNRRQQQHEALDFVRALMDVDIPFKAIENPVSVISTQIKKPTQIIQPYEYGYPETKKTCLWLEGLPKLIPTNIVEPQFIICQGKKYSPTHYHNFGNGEIRSKTYEGIAKAMADQWGYYILMKDIL